MKMPQRPPDFDALRATILLKNSKRMFTLLGHSSPTINGRYMHWDKLRHLKPPEGLSLEEWWFSVKYARTSIRKLLPLKNTQGRSFAFAQPDPIPEHLHHIDQAAGGQLELPGKEIANSDMRDRYVIHSLTEEAITSSQLEGAVTTRQVAKEMIRSGRPPRDQSERMIFNNFAAMEHIRQWKNRPLDEELILDLHRILTDQAIDKPDAVGRFRRADEPVHVMDNYNEVMHTPPPAEELSARMALMCDFANEKAPNYFIHPVIRAVILHFWMAYDHPFVDGNGRCARALFYWSMLKQGAWLCEFISISQLIRKAPIKYGRAFLYTETDDNDLTYFILYHLDIILKAFEELKAYIQRKTETLQQVEKTIRTSVEFNHRQLALLGHALRHPEFRYTIQSHQSSHGVVYQTARTDLLDLVEKGCLVQTKIGKTMIFSPAQDLEHKLKG